MRRGVLPTVAGVLLAVVGVVVAPPARSQETCRTRCWDAYGACYTSTSDRQRCQAQLLRCLNNCIRAKRSPATQRRPQPAHPTGHSDGCGT
ncbi:MAG: hypothetical protein J2P50_11060 [Hyphomicrobiaceae bacterium]|nr:hypothetical protein [Hyphomicrobiaceae bacterium]